MPTPTNLPATSTGGQEIQNPALFSQLTERQMMPQTESEIPEGVFGKTQRLVIEKVGVLAKIRLLVTIEYTPKEEEKAIPLPGWPWKILKEVALQANGVTGVIAAGGITLQMRRLRIYRNPAASAAQKTKAVGTKLKKEAITEVFVVEIPIAHDMLTLVGSLLAQNEETQLSVLLTWASEEECMEAGALEKVKGKVKWLNTVFSVGSTVIGKQEVTVLPDLSAFHGLLESEKSFSATGEQRTELIRTAGQLLCYTLSVQNKAGGKVVIKVGSEWTSLAVEYGGNKKPLQWTPAEQIAEENADDYDGELVVAKYNFYAVDFEKDNTARDMIIPESLTELRGVTTLATFTPESAIIRSTQETLYPAV